MSYSEVKASNVQKECMAIIKWDAATREHLSKQYARFEKLTIKYINQGIKPTWWNKNPKRPHKIEDWYELGMGCRSYKQFTKFWQKKHVRWLRWHQGNGYAKRAKVLLKLAERALSESNKLDMASIMLSAEDAHYLKTTMDKTKEKK